MFTTVRRSVNFPRLWVRKKGRQVLIDYDVKVGLYEVSSSSVGNITPVTPPFTIETLLTSDQFLTHYSSQEPEPQTGWRAVMAV